MAITEGWSPPRCAQGSHRRPDPEKQNVPPFRGGTWQAFYAGGGHCQPLTRRPDLSDEPPCDARVACGKIRLPCFNDGTCGRNHADSCAGVTPYCSLWAVGYDISCGGFNPYLSLCSA